MKMPYWILGEAPKSLLLPKRWGERAQSKIVWLVREKTPSDMT